MTLLMLGEDALGTLVLFVDHAQYLVVHDLGCGLRVGALELVFLVAVIADIRQFLTHTGISNHAIGLFGGTLEVVHRAGGDGTDKQLLSSTAT